MNIKSRINNSIINIFISLFFQILSLIIIFISRKIILVYLSEDYLGIVNLFNNIITILSLAELGIGSSITFLLFKPLAEKNTVKIKQYMNFCKKVYLYIGILVFIAGIIMIPFLYLIVKDPGNVENVNLIFFIIVCNTGISYFYSYKRILIIADQKNYINVINTNLFHILQNVLQIIIVILYKNFILFLLAQVVITFVSNLFISKYVNKKYDYTIQNNEQLSKEDRKTIFKNIKALIFHKIGGVVVTGTDNILISIFIDLATVAYYNSYILIVNTIRNILSQIFIAINSNIGNSLVTESKETNYTIFNVLFFLNSLLVIICCCFLFIILDPFIELWLGKKFVLDRNIVLSIIFLFFVYTMQVPIGTFKNSAGLYTKDKWKPLIEAAINLTFSIILATHFGLIGIIIGSIISMVFTNFWLEPYIVYKYVFERKTIKYLLKYLTYFAIIIITLGVNDFILYYYKLNFTMLIITLLISILLPSSLMFISIIKTDTYDYLLKIIKKILRKNKKENV